MNDREARNQALLEWLLEISAFWVVFALLDRLVEDKRFFDGVEYRNRFGHTSRWYHFEERDSR